MAPPSENPDDLPVTPSPILRPEGFTDIIERSYEESLNAFVRFGISLEGIPTIEQIAASANFAELFERARNGIRQPGLILVPPMTRFQLAAAIDSNIAGLTNYEGREFEGTSLSVLKVDYAEINDDSIWGNESDLKWEALIADVNAGSVLDRMADDLEGDCRKVRRVVESMQRLKLRPMSGAREYLALQMVALAQGRQLDTRTHTVLNALDIMYEENVYDKPSKSLARGRLSFMLVLETGPCFGSNNGVGVRPSIILDYRGHSSLE